MNSKLTTRLGLEQRDEPYGPFTKAVGYLLVGGYVVILAVDGVLLASVHHAVAHGSALVLGLLAVVLLVFDLTVNTGNET